MERFSFIFLVAGLGFFGLSFVISGWVPMMPVQHLEVRTIEQIAEQPPLEFLELKEQYPEAFKKAFEEKHYKGAASLKAADSAAFAEALKLGHKIYIGEACWHCHSQQVRPWGNDEFRYGQVSFPEEYNNTLNMPPLWGTRRIGPDLIRRGGEQSNDWHVAHFYRPRDVNPISVMPDYPWFYEDDGLTPNKKGLAIITYVQWLGSWQNSQRVDLNAIENVERNNPKPNIEGAASGSDDAQDTPAKGGGDDTDPFGGQSAPDGNSGNDKADDDPFGSDDGDDPFGS